MSPAEAKRAALRLADALDVIADERRRDDACSWIVAAHAGCVDELCRGFEAGPADDTWPVHPVIVARRLHGATLDDLTRWAEAWRTWGRS